MGEKKHFSQRINTPNSIRHCKIGVLMCVTQMHQYDKLYAIQITRQIIKIHRQFTYVCLYMNNKHIICNAHTHTHIIDGHLGEFSHVMLWTK